MKRDSGFGLLEVLVAAGVAAGLMLAISTMMSFMNRSVQTSRVNTDFIGLVNQLQGTFNNSSLCQTVMAPYTLNPSGTFPQPLMSSITSNGQATGTVIVPKPPAAYGSTLQITKLEFETKATSVGTSGNQYLASLYLEATKNVGAGGAVGLQTLSHTFPLLVTLNASNQITGCSGQSDSLWQRAANDVDIYYNNGNVGIGTSTPAAPLEIEGSSLNYDKATLALGYISLPTKSRIVAGVGAGATAITTNLGNNSSNQLVMDDLTKPAWDILIDSGSDAFAVYRYPPTASNPVSPVNASFVINNQGNVGIGVTATPTYGLQVLKTSPDGTQIGVDNGTGPAIWSQINFLKAGVAQSFIGQDTANNLLAIGGQQANAGFDSVRIRPAGGSADVMTVKRSGNVGIGTTSPATTLDVVGGIRPGGVSQGTGCSIEGAFGYDFAAHAPMYCTGTIWKRANGGGMYQIHLCDGSCRLPNPYTGACSCPPGYTAAQVGDMDAPTGAPCGSQTFYDAKGMVQYLCY